MLAKASTSQQIINQKLSSNIDFQDTSSNKSEVDMNKQTWHYTKLVNCA